MKDVALGKVNKKAESSGYILIDGQEVEELEEQDEILDIKDNFSTEHQNPDQTEIDSMIKILEKEKQDSKKKNFQGVREAENPIEEAQLRAKAEGGNVDGE